MAATSGRSTNKWIRYCMENSAEVSNFIQRTVPRVGAIVDLRVPKECQGYNIPGDENDELVSYLVKKYKTLQKSDAHTTVRIGLVSSFISGRLSVMEESAVGKTTTVAMGVHKSTSVKRKHKTDNRTDTTTVDRPLRAVPTLRKKNPTPVASTNKETSPENKDKRGHIWFTCTCCFNYVSNRRDSITRHMLRCKEGRKDETDSQKKNAIKQSLDKIKEAHEELGIRLFFNPRDFENRLYNKEEVLGILSYFGHSAVARKAEKRYPEVKPSTVNVTGRTFKKFSFKPIGDTCDPNIHEEMDTEEMRIPIEAGRGQLERASLEDVDHEEAGIEKEEDTATSRQDTELNTPTVQEDIEDNDRAVGTGRGQLERASLEDVDHEEAGIEKEEGTATSRREYGIVSGVTQEDVTEDEDIKVPLGRQEVLTEYLCHSKETRDNVCRHKDPRVTVKTENVGLMWNAYSQNVQIATDVTSSAQLALQEADTAAVHTPKKRKIDPASPKAPPSAGKSRVTKALIDKYGSIADAEIPAPSELVLYGIKKDKRVQVSRALRYEREVTIYKEAASYLLNRLTKSTGKRVENITEVPWDQPEVPHSVSRGRVLKDNLLRRYMGLILADDKARKAARTDDDVVA